MKQYLNQRTILSLFIAGFTLVSCSKDLNTPARDTDASITAASADGISTGPITLLPKLTKHGSRVLSYGSLGELTKVVFDNNYQTSYSIMNQHGKITHVGTNTSDGNTNKRFVYPLNSSALASSIRAEELVNGVWDLSWEDTYTYNGNKQLIKISSNSGHYDFAYDANGDVTSITYTNWQNKLVKETIFWYTTGNSALIPDKNRINPEDIWVDPYLRIFGKFRKHLPRRIKYTNYLPNGTKTDFRYDYILDANGYITTEKKLYTFSNFIAEIKTYEYQ